MSDRPKTTKPLKIRLIRRRQVQQTLALASVLALLISSCGKNYNKYSTSSNSTSINQNQNSNNENVEAVFYENVAQCEADTKKQQEDYDKLLKAHQEQKVNLPPVAPKLKPEECAAHMQAAHQEHEKNAPVYRNLEDCQAEGVRCERTPSSYRTRGYRPVFGGSYFYFTHRDWGGTRHRVYEPRTVYRSNTPGQVVTPSGRTVTKTSPGRTNAPRHTTVPAPKRPSGKTGQGTIKGRSSKGFGSTYKSTGRGGK